MMDSNYWRKKAAEGDTKITRLRAELAAEKERAEWRSIETAPLDEPVLVWGWPTGCEDSNPSAEVAFWHQSSEGWCVSASWCLFTAAHWQPLPSGPTAIRASNAAPKDGDPGHLK